MALVGNMIADAFAGNPSLVNYDMFVAVFGMLSLFYLIPASIKEEIRGHPIIMVAHDVLNTIFFFCAAVAMAAELKVHSCSNVVCTEPVAKLGTNTNNSRRTTLSTTRSPTAPST